MDRHRGVIVTGAVVGFGLTLGPRALRGFIEPIGLESHRIACTGLECLGRSYTRQCGELASGQIARRCIHNAHGACGLVAETKGRGRIRATGSAKRASGQILTRNTLALNPGHSEKIRFQVYHVSTNVAHFGASHKAKRISALVGILKLHGHLGVGKHARGLLFTDQGHIRRSNAIPGAVPGRCGTRDFHLLFEATQKKLPLL